MIIDHLNNSTVYEGLHPDIAYALHYLQTHPIEQMAPGKYDIPGKDMFLLIQSYETRLREEGFWEAHQSYVDVQYMIEGSEVMGYAHAPCLTVTENHLSTKDYVVLEGEGDFFTVKEGHFVIFYPEDAHMPCLAKGQPQHIKKAVMKLRLYAHH